MLQEFKAFILRGNVVDMAVGVILGGAFGKIVTSLVNDIIMPPIGMLLGNVDFKDLMLTLKPAEGAIPAVAIRYGEFINQSVNFMIVAAAIFFTIKAINKLSRRTLFNTTTPK